MSNNGDTKGFNIHPFIGKGATYVQTERTEKTSFLFLFLA